MPGSAADHSGLSRPRRSACRRGGGDLLCHSVRPDYLGTPSIQRAPGGDARASASRPAAWRPRRECAHRTASWRSGHRASEAVGRASDCSRVSPLSGKDARQWSLRSDVWSRCDVSGSGEEGAILRASRCRSSEAQREGMCTPCGLAMRRDIYLKKSLRSQVLNSFCTRHPQLFHTRRLLRTA